MPVQTTYSNSFVRGIVGQLADGGDDHVIKPMSNGEASASIPFGYGVKFGATDNAALLPTAETSKIVGIVVHSHAYGRSPYGDLDTAGVKPGGNLNVIRKGRVLVTAEDAVVPGDRLWVRCTAGGAGEVVGGLTNADEGTETIDCTAQGVWMSTAAAGGLAVLEVDFTNKP